MAAINDTTRSSTSSDSSSSSRDSDSIPAASAPSRKEETDVAAKINASSEVDEETGKAISKDTETEPQVATEETSEEFGIELSNEELLKRRKLALLSTGYYLNKHQNRASSFSTY
jgi:hypothetical protein